MRMRYDPEGNDVIPLDIPNEYNVIFDEQGTGRVIAEGPFKHLPKKGENFWLYSDNQPLGSIWTVLHVAITYNVNQENCINKETHYIRAAKIGECVKE